MSTAIEAVSLQSQLQMYDEARAAYSEACKAPEGESIDEYETWEDAQLAGVGGFPERTRLSTHPALWNIEALQVGDKPDLVLTCTVCREHLCDVEPSDNFAVLMSMAFDHIRERHLVPEGEENHR